MTSKPFEAAVIGLNSQNVTAGAFRAPDWGIMNTQAQTLILQARAFAMGAHAAMGQVRKITGEPYFNHPFRAAEVAQAFGCDWQVICGCYLHDTVEDTSVTIELINDTFGGIVRRIVNGVTNVATRESGLNRAARFELNVPMLTRKADASGRSTPSFRSKYFEDRWRRITRKNAPITLEDSQKSTRLRSF